MRGVVAVGGFVAAAVLAAAPVSGQDVGSLKREIDLLKRENEILKRENDLLKQELAAIKKGAGKDGPGDKPEPKLVVTADDVEYAYKGAVRNGPEMVVTLLATSKNGERRAPMGQMTIIDGEGTKYLAMPVGGFGAPQVLREGVPLKLMWRFGPNFLTKMGSAPPARFTAFPSLSVEDMATGRTAVEFRDVPATLPTQKKK